MEGPLNTVAPALINGISSVTLQRGEKKTARRAGQQPISGLVSFQHLSGVEPSGRLRLRQREDSVFKAHRRTVMVLWNWQQGGGLRHQVIIKFNIKL